jgi:hypothetical protein
MFLSELHPSVWDLRIQIIDQKGVLSGFMTDFSFWTRLIVRFPESIPKGNIIVPITSIGMAAFQGFAIRSLSIPKSIRRIDENSFLGCSSLKTLIFEQRSLSLQISSHAFCRCSSLKSVTLPKTVTELGVGCFERCLELSEFIFEFGSELRTLESSLFCECHRLTTFAIPDSVESLKSHCFQNCKQLSNIAFSVDSHCRNLEARLFWNCRSLHLLYLPKSVRVIDIHTFDGCYISYLIIDSGNQWLASCNGIIFNRSFTLAIRCLSLEAKILMPSSVESVGPECFSGCRRLQHFICEEDSHLREITGSAFQYCFSLTKVILPNTVLELPKTCFESCLCLTAFEIARDSRIRNIGGLFAGHRFLQTIVVPYSVEILETNCFKDCIKLRVVVFDEDCLLREIRSKAFDGCSSLDSLSLPKGIEVIDQQAFDGSALTAVTIDCRNPHIRASCNLLLNAEQILLIQSLVKIEMMTIPTKVEIIKEFSFQYCGSLKEIHGQGSHIQVIERHAFESCYELQRVFLPNTLTILMDSCFIGCSSLTFIQFSNPPSLTRIHANAFRRCTSLIEFVLPESVECICQSAFADCSNLSEIRIKQNSQLQIIEQLAFQNSSVQHFVIPPLLCYIGAAAFSHPCKFDYSSENHKILIPQWLSRFLLDSKSEFDCRDIPPPHHISDSVLDLNEYHEFPDSTQSLISRNSHGEVRLYQHDRTNEQIAMKTYWSESNGFDSQEQFLREIETLVRIQHPCVVRFIGYCLPVEKLGARIAMQYIGPHSLKTVLESSIVFEWWTSTTKTIVIIGIVVGMYLIHTAGIRHHDLKPSNILLDPVTHFPKITDFGSSQFEVPGPTITSPTGSPGYMAPELWTQQISTQKIDVFSFGIILYEIVIGQRAFNRRLNSYQLMNHICNGHRPPIPGNLPMFVQELMLLCWNHDPEKRPMFKDIFILLRDNQFQIFEDVNPNDISNFVKYLSMVENW